ncbi:hypothetical protein [Shouchella clausii]|uniref:hypothetical protein n=1 Tax=Shouchella clausii TaxID=79880 RepID=UPI000B99F6BE|nr:hypothetical protein [Shouchella clausii]AST95320.1 hypothetical protein BC8716_04690 [Shouchella clausii]MBU8595453.1 hypothetical protein [Shouchella clausii]MCR1286781.1 hypothetical protein [Shouchella clausii]MCY1103500.1 hypothetical protein [Shouchella clausii]MEB5471885.1 hypothetical protein [Shouchella clausii]
MIDITLLSVFEQKQITAKKNIAIILKGMKKPYKFNVNWLTYCETKSNNRIFRISSTLKMRILYDRQVVLFIFFLPFKNSYIQTGIKLTASYKEPSAYIK